MYRFKFFELPYSELRQILMNIKLRDDNRIWENFTVSSNIIWISWIWEFIYQSDKNLFFHLFFRYFSYDVTTKESNIGEYIEYNISFDTTFFQTCTLKENQLSLYYYFIFYFFSLRIYQIQILRDTNLMIKLLYIKSLTIKIDIIRICITKKFRYYINIRKWNIY